MRWLCVLALVGCGRVAFDATGDARMGAGDGAPPPRVAQLPCNTNVFLDSGGDLSQDGLAWVRDGADDWMIAILHVADTVHPIERYAITETPLGLHLTDMGAIHQAVHAHYPGVADVPGGHVLAFFDDGAGTASAVRLGPGLIELATHPLGGLANGDPPLARAGGGALAVVGLMAGQITVRELTDDGVPTNTATLLPIAGGPDFPTLVALDTGLAVVWQAASTGHCRLTKLNADLSLAAGPVDLVTGMCTRPQVAWVPAARRIVVTATDASTSSVVAAVWDDALAPTVAPFQVAAQGYGAQVVGDGDSAWIAWVRNADSAMQYARVAADGSVTLGPALGQIDTSLTHYHALQYVDGFPVVLWGDVGQGISFAAARLCR